MCLVCSKNSKPLPQFLNPWIKSRLLEGQRMARREGFVRRNSGVLRVMACVLGAGGGEGPCLLPSSLVSKEFQSGFLEDLVWGACMRMDGRSEWTGVWPPPTISGGREMGWQTALAKNQEVGCHTPKGNGVSVPHGWEQGRAGWGRLGASSRVQTNPCSYKLEVDSFEGVQNGWQLTPRTGMNWHESRTAGKLSPLIGIFTYPVEVSFSGPTWLWEWEARIHCYQIQQKLPSALFLLHPCTLTPGGQHPTGRGRGRKEANHNAFPRGRWSSGNRPQVGKERRLSSKLRSEFVVPRDGIFYFVIKWFG